MKYKLAVEVYNINNKKVVEPVVIFRLNLNRPGDFLCN
jgi:hypothetical protein